jgi:hypothetical protein
MSFYTRIDTNTISHYFKGYWENTTNHRAALQALMKRGHIETGISGSNLVWNFRAGRYETAAYGDAESIDISRKNHYKQANLPWAFITTSDGITRDEIALAQGEFALVRHEKEMLKNLTNDFETRVNADFLRKDGPASAGNVLYGCPSFFAHTSSGASSKTAAASDSYAGHSTALNGITGVDGAESNAWSPTIVNYTSTAFNGGSAATWEGQALKALTFAKDSITFGNKEEEQPDLVFVTGTMLSDVKNLITAQQRMVITTSPGDAGPQGLGIVGSVQHDGLEIAKDVDMAAGEAYMLNFRQIWLECLPKVSVENPGPKLTGNKKPEYFEVLTEDDIRSNGILVRVNLRAQFRFNPRYHALLKNIA